MLYFSFNMREFEDRILDWKSRDDVELIYFVKRGVIF